MEPKDLSVKQKLKVLVESLDGAESTNQTLSQCKDAEEMLDVLLAVSSDLGLELTREDLKRNPPIRDWVWWKNKEALVKLGDGTLRHQQDASKRTRWDSWSIRLMKIFRK